MLASDGLWDTHTNEEAVALVTEMINFSDIYYDDGFGDYNDEGGNVVVMFKKFIHDESKQRLSCSVNQ